MSEEVIEKSSARERSPSFPFISLKSAISRMVEFEQKFGRQDAPADRAYLAWGYKGDTSQSAQTLAALKAFGLVTYKGSGPKRLVSISDEGRTYLRAQQESIRRNLLKKFALTPKWIASFWPIWGTDRGPNEVCLDTLVLTHRFNDNSAPKFLAVYDETIRFAGLEEDDKISAGQQDADDGDGDAIIEQTESLGAPVEETVRAPIRASGMKISDLFPSGEREWIRGPLSKDTSYRLLVTGEIGPKEIGKLIKLLKAQQSVLMDDEEDEEDE